jgi:hypothetical protein
MANPFAPPSAVDVGPAIPPRTDVTDTVIELLSETRPWVKLMAVLTFITVPLMVLASVGVALVTGLRNAASFLPLMITLLVYVPAAVFLWKYAGSIRELQRGGGQRALEAALRSQKSFWKFVGIYACVLLSLYGVVVVGAILVGLMGAPRTGG